MRMTGLSCVIGAMTTLSIAQIGIANDAKPAEIIVLSTLHQHHEDVPGYSFQDLTEIIEQLDPQVLAVELTEADLKSRREQRVKQEYQRSVFPLLDKHNYEVVPLEPEQPLFGELVGLHRTAQQNLSEDNPCAEALFGTYADSLFQLLSEKWVSAAAVNSRETDSLFELKHRFQSEVYGPLGATVWERWNQHFLERILDAANENEGERILVLVGAEHAYWLRAHLATAGVKLLDTERLLAAAGHAGSTAEAEEERVLAIEDEYVAAEVSRDEATLRRLVDEKFRYNSRSGTTSGKEELIESVLEMSMVGQTITERSIMVEGNIAIIFGTAELRFLDAGEAESITTLRYTSTYVKRQGQWRMLALQMQQRAKP